MQRRSQPHQESTSPNIMAVILQSLPQEAGLTKIEYEGPRIALYTKNPVYMFKNVQLVSNMVNTIKRRIVVRTEESLRTQELECRDIISKSVSKEAGLTDIFFDPVIGEAVAFVRKPWHIAQALDDSENIDLIEKTGWRVRIRKAPDDISLIRSIYEILASTATERMRFYRDIGEKIFREKLTEDAEASVMALGGFAEVGRSCIMVVTGDSKILLDCGMNLFAKDSLSALPRFDISGVLMEEIDAVIITHAHMDHAGFLPTLYKYGYEGPVYCSDPTLPLMYLLQKNYVQKAGQKALYAISDVNNEVMHTIPLNFGVVTDISPDIRLTLSNTGHIIGSSSIHLHIGTGDHNLVYSGDMKFGKSIALENAALNFPRLETLILESTYGSKDDVFDSRERVESMLAEIINASYQKNGTILIPVPAVGVSQEIILLLDMLMQSGKLPPQLRIVVDSAISSATSVYEAFPEYLDRDVKDRILRSESTQFGFSENFVRPESVIQVDSPSIILSPSACLSGFGHSLDYLRQISTSDKNLLLFITYQPQETLGRMILEGGRKIPSVTSDTEEMELHCKVQSLFGLDGHSDFNQLLNYVSRLRPKLRRILINHGERARAQNLASSISKILKIQTQHPLVQEAVKLL